MILFVKLFFSRPKRSKELIELVKVVMRDIDGYLGELGREMKGVADYWGLDLGIVVGLNLIYELRRVRVEHVCM